MGIKGCWTCRARKVRCDGLRPECANCSKSAKACQGYGIQLSWPRDGDKRRAMTHAVSPQSRQRRPRGRHTVFVNSSAWDLSLSEILQERRDLLGENLPPFRVPHLPYLPSALLIQGQADLLDFFNAYSSSIMSPFIDDELAHFILRAALNNPSSPSNLILEGICTIASLQLHGHSKSLGRRSSLISKLQENLIHTDRENVLQNLIGTMLLYQYEVLTMTRPDLSWRILLGGAKKIIIVSSALDWLRQDDGAVLLDWIYYHEVSSEFSVRHWADADSIDNICKGPLAMRPREAGLHHVGMSNSTAHLMDALDLMRIVCKHPLANQGGDMPYYALKREQVHQLKHNLQQAIGEAGTLHDSCGAPLTRQLLTAHLYTCAALIYLNRAVGNIGAASSEQTFLFRQGIIILQHLGSCESAWPLIVLASEASEDDQRLQMLDILTSTEQERFHRSNHVPLIRLMVEAIWNQNDLNRGSNVSYVETLHAVVSMAPSLPLFA